MRGCEHAFIAQCLVPEPMLLNCQDVMPKTSKRSDDRKRKILVGEKPTCQLGRLVILDLLIDLRSMRAGIRPGMLEIIGMKRGIRLQ